LKNDNAYLCEIMESIQGEGLLAGARQIFIRFSGCNLNCSYCDTKLSLKRPEKCVFYSEPVYGGNPRFIDNPLEIKQLLKLIKSYDAKWISLTGGEPLLWAEYIARLASYLKADDYKIMLETNGVLYKQLEKCLDYIDLISMDYKLPSSTGRSYSEEHAKFLSIASTKDTYIKMVITETTNWAEVKEAVNIIKNINPQLILYLQPVTPCPGVKAADFDMVLAIQKYCLNYLAEVRVLPQIHQLFNWR
jgi:7-carboxy-7-deazaguanine synthase